MKPRECSWPGLNRRVCSAQPMCVDLPLDRDWKSSSGVLSITLPWLSTKMVNFVDPVGKFDVRGLARKKDSNLDER